MATAGIEGWGVHTRTGIGIVIASFVHRAPLVRILRVGQGPVLNQSSFRALPARRVLWASVGGAFVSGVIVSE